MNIQRHDAQSWAKLTNDFLSKRSVEPQLAVIIRAGRSLLTIDGVAHHSPWYDGEAPKSGFLNRVDPRSGPSAVATVAPAAAQIPSTGQAVGRENAVNRGEVADGSELWDQVTRSLAGEAEPAIDAATAASFRAMLGTAPAAPVVQNSGKAVDNHDGSDLVDQLNRALLDDTATPVTQKPRQSSASDDGAGLLSILERSL